MVKTLFLLIATGLIACACTTLDPPMPVLGPAKPEPATPPSMLTLSMKTSWAGLQQAADSAIPKCAGSPPVCLGSPTDNFILQHEDAWDVVGKIAGKDIGVKSSVWRWDPVQLSYTNANQTLAASQHVLYHVKVGFTQFGGFASCGYNQPAREMNIGLTAKVSLMPAWYVNADFAAGAQAINPCQITLANIDVTDKLVGVLQNALNKATGKLSDVVRQKTDVRDRASQVWARLSEPVDLGNSFWLTLNPDAVSANPLVLDNDNNLNEIVSLNATPTVTSGNKPSPVAVPLPDITNKPVASPDFEINLRGTVPFSDVNDRLTSELAGKSFSVGTDWISRNLSFHISSVRIQADGDKVEIALDVGGSAEGTLYLYGVPKFVPSADGGGSIVLSNIDYYPETHDYLVKLGNIIFHNKIEVILQQQARWDISKQLHSAFDSVNKAVNSEPAPGIKVTGMISTFGTQAQIWVGKNNLDVLFPAKGNVSVFVSPAF